MYRHAGPLHLSAEDVPQTMKMNSHLNVEKIEPVSNDLETMENSAEDLGENNIEPVDGTSGLMVTSNNSNQILNPHGLTSNAAREITD